MASSSYIVTPELQPILVTLPTLSAYLISGSLTVDRIAPPIFFTCSLCLLVAAFRPTLPIALFSMALIITADVVLAIDHIVSVFIPRFRMPELISQHGECWYPVLIGQNSYHKERMGELAWYRVCVQSSLAFWVMALTG